MAWLECVGAMRNARLERAFNKQREQINQINQEEIGA
jgi:hypothetical protein